MSQLEGAWGISGPNRETTGSRPVGGIFQVPHQSSGLSSAPLCGLACACPQHCDRRQGQEGERWGGLCSPPAFHLLPSRLCSSLSLERERVSPHPQPQGTWLTKQGVPGTWTSDWPGSLWRVTSARKERRRKLSPAHSAGSPAHRAGCSCEGGKGLVRTFPLANLSASPLQQIPVLTAQRDRLWDLFVSPAVNVSPREYFHLKGGLTPQCTKP